MLLVVQIDPEFERHLESGGSADVQVIADGRNSNTAGTALGYVSGIVQQFNAAWSADHGAPPRSAQVVTRAWYNPNLETRWFMIPGMIGTLTLIQTMMLTAMSVAREREQGTFDQLLVTPFRPFEIMAGKALPSMVVGTIQAGGVLLVAQLWFRIPFAGSYATLFAGLLLFLLAAVGIGLLISAVAATMQQAMLYSMLLIMPFSLLSGLTTPISSMPAMRAVPDRDQPAALRDRHHAARLPGGSGTRSADRRSVAAGADRLAHPDGGLLDVQPPHAMTTVSSPHRHARNARLSIASMAVLLAGAAPSGRTSCRPSRKRPGALVGSGARGGPRAIACGIGNRAVTEQPARARRLVGRLSGSGAQLADRARPSTPIWTCAPRCCGSRRRGRSARSQRQATGLPFPPTPPTAGNA